MKRKVKVGQVWINESGDRNYKITRLADDVHGTRRAYGIDSNTGQEETFVALEAGDYITLYFWHVVEHEKIIPGIPLDLSLPLLQAGHLQDRMRKKYKNG